MFEKIRHRAIATLGGIVPTPQGFAEAHDRHLAVAEATAEARTDNRASLAREDRGWQRLSGGGPAKLGGFTLDQQRGHAMRLWHYSPLARGIVEINLGFQLADGVSFTAGDEFDQAIVDEFWNHPVNNFGVTFIDRVRSLMLTGEACWPVFTEPNTGLQRVADLHPSLIHDVIPDPDNSSQAIGVIKRQTADHPERRFRVINIGGDAMFSPAALQLRDSFTDGECHFFAVNRIGGLRGTSDLMPALDWIEAYERALFGELERWALLRNFIWDVTLHGATQEQINARAAELAANPPRPGDVRIHNESEEWKSLAPDLGAYEASNISRLMRNHILAATGTPEHWVGGGGDVNRATAGEMDEPTLKILTARRNFLTEIILTLQRYNLASQSAANGRAVGPDQLAAVAANWPQMASPDTAKFSTALAQVAATAVNIMHAGIGDRRFAIAMILKMAEHLGITADPEALLTAAEQEHAARQAADPAFGGFGGGFGGDPFAAHGDDPDAG